MSLSKPQRRTQGSKGGRRPRIFIVDDEILIIRGLEESLDDLGYAACGFALSGEEAMACLERRRPDLVLVDVRLQGEMDGIDLAGRVTSRLGIPVIFITAYSDRDTLKRAKVTAPSGYLVKPIRQGQLKVSIELALDRLRRDREQAALLAGYRTTLDALQSRLAERDRDLLETCNALESARAELERKSAKLEELRGELQDVDRSLMALTGHMARMREELEIEVAAAVRTRIMPILKQLRADPGFQQHRIELEMLGMYLDQLSSNLGKPKNGETSLSTTELRIAALVKNDLTTEQIANQLFISPETVKSHRRNIRRKLHIQNTKTNLSTHLKCQMAKAL